MVRNGGQQSRKERVKVLKDLMDRLKEVEQENEKQVRLTREELARSKKLHEEHLYGSRV